MNTSRSILAALLTGGALLTATTAFAQVDNGMIHGPVPEQAYAQPHMVQAAVVIVIGTATATGSATNGCATTRMITVRRDITTTTTATITANRRSQDLVVKAGFPQGEPVFFRLLPYVWRARPAD
jgi:hypothetical protein